MSVSKVSSPPLAPLQKLCYPDKLKTVPGSGNQALRTTADITAASWKGKFGSGNLEFKIRGKLMKTWDWGPAAPPHYEPASPSRTKNISFLSH